MGTPFASLPTRLRAALERSEFWTDRTRANSTHISELICPECGRREAWAYAERPFSIICNRQSKCGARVPTLELFPEVRQKVERDFPPTPADPDRPARAYLAARGLERSLRDLAFKHWSQTRNGCAGAVMFPVADGVWNGRLYDPPKGSGKTHNWGSTSKKFWQHPGQPIDPEQPVYVVEGILDALSLIESGHQAIAVLSAGADPAGFTIPGEWHLITAFDGDEAGTKATRKWAAWADAEGLGIGHILPPAGRDWNDLLCSMGTEDFKTWMEEQREELAFNARLALAESGYAWANAWYEHRERTCPLFTFGRAYWTSKHTEKDGVQAWPVSTFTATCLQVVKDISNDDEHESRFLLEVTPEKGPATRQLFAAAEISSPAALKTAMLNRVHQAWTGEKIPTDAFLRQIVASRAPVVRQLPWIGYDDASGWHVWPGFAFDQQGKLHRPDGQGLFALNKHSRLRPARQSCLDIPDAPTVAPADLWRLLHAAWGDNAAVALAWTIGSLFVRGIKQRIGFYPFLSLKGDPACGKSGLIRYCNHVQGLDEEGLPMNKVNTSKGEIRKLAQRSGMFTALLELNVAESARFSIETILPLYNCNPLQVQAVKDQTFTTKETPFLGTLAFVQNVEPFTSRAQHERVISLHFDKDACTEESKTAFDLLLEVPRADFLGIAAAVLQHKERVAAGWHAGWQEAKKALARAIPDNRLCENHALVLAFHTAITRCLGISHDLIPYISEIGAEKFRRCSGGEQTEGDYFLETLVERAETVDGWSNWYSEDEATGTIYVNLADGLKALRDAGYPVPMDVGRVQKALKQHPAYMEASAYRRMNGKGRRAWAFSSTVLERGIHACNT